MIQQVKKKYAFISYSHKDERIAIWLQRKLESYRLPTQIHNEFDGSRYLRPVFRDSTDLDTGILSDELYKHLDNSKFLIVICSNNSVCSKWVSAEVEYFIRAGRLAYVIPFVIEEGSVDNPLCYPSYLYEYLKEHPEQELLSINTKGLRREKAYVKIVSRMLGVSFDELWRRHEREKRRNAILYTICCVLLLMVFYLFAIPINLSICLKDENHNLPMPKLGYLEFRNQHYVLNDIDTVICIDKLAGYNRFKTHLVHFEAVYYKCTDTLISMNLCKTNEIRINLVRDETFSVYSGKVFNEDGFPVDSAIFKVKGYTSITDHDGRFHISLPLHKQTECSEIEIIKDGYEVYKRSDEVPGQNLCYILRYQDGVD